jgi:hypothetical protein
MLLGFSNTTSGGVALPVDLGALGLPGCQLHVALDQAAILAGTFGQATFALPIPDDPFLRGGRFYLQAVAVDPWVGNPLGATVSDAAEVVIGWR